MKTNVFKSTLILLFILTATAFRATAQTNIQKTSFKVQGNCEMCKKKIEAGLQVNGVVAAQWNPDSKMLKVKFDASKISADSMQHLVANAGYDTERYKASDDAYNSLANCCKYRSGKCHH